MASININTAASKRFSDTLRQMHKSALPVAVRSALNSAAFDVKKTTMPESAKKNFIHRKPTFFKANSKVEPATGFDVNSMKSTVGFVKISGKGNTVEDLEEQEGGGDIGGRSFIPLKQARTGNSWNKTVRSKARISDIKSKIVDSRRAKGKTDEEKFIKSAIHAGVNGWVLGNRENGRGNKLLWIVKSITRKKWNTKIKATPMFSVRSKRKIHVKSTNFMKKASVKSGTSLEKFYIDAAKKQIDKFK